MPKLEPQFDFAKDESDFLIHRSPAEICINQNHYSGDGEVHLQLYPNSKIYLNGLFSDVPPEEFLGSTLGQTEVSSFSIFNTPVDGFILSSGDDIQNKEFNLNWGPSSEPVYCIGNDSSQIRQIIFHLFNFIDLIGTRPSIEEIGKKSISIEHVDLENEDLSIEIKSLLTTQSYHKELKENGGYRITHVGVLRRLDNTEFSGRDAIKYLRTLRLFLSFSVGRWCNPVCCVGFDSSEKRIWESWSSPNEPWRSNSSWFDPHHSNQLASLFPGFMSRLSSEDWQDAIHEVIYWYLNSNNSSRGIDAGIILTQAAIERLSYEYSVVHKRLLWSNGFKDLAASDKYRMLFSSLNIPIDISNNTPTLKNLAKKFKWLDAPHALTEIRNSLVHPEHKKRGQFSTAYYEAWNLNLWFLEMGILAICDYSGTYANRLDRKRVGQVDDIPWYK